MPLAVAARARSAAPRRDAGRRPAVSDLAAFAAACKAEAAALITDHLGAVKAIADALVEHGELAGAEVDDIIAAALAREGLAEEQMRRQRKWHAIGASAAMFDIKQSPMRRGAPKSKRIDLAVSLIRGGVNLRQACEAVRLPNAKCAVARRCDQRGVLRKHSASGVRNNHSRSGHRATAQTARAESAGAGAPCT